jgi:hypothetical protein
MDKALFRAYVRELVKETVEEEVNKILPKLLGEAIGEIKSLQEGKVETSKKPKVSRAQLAEMMGLERLGDTIIATTKNVGPVMAAPPQGIAEDNPAFQAINKDYSQLMKKMGLSK